MFENETRIPAAELDSLPAPLRLELQSLLLGHRSLKSFIEILANAPLVLEAFLVFGNSLDRCGLSQELQAKLFLAIGESMSSEYDVSAATARAKSLGISEEEIRRCRCGTSDIPAHEAALAFAKKLVRKHGHLSEEELSEFTRTVEDPRTLIEIVAAVSRIHFTALINNLAVTPADHPLAKEIRG
ncbi:carboxymuconolactone decarboxylase family protein [Pelagicoccus albus]|uniref:Alkylhydroperoxidase family enzyme, contains CxxC motif n=1 Tax=Pelagicoccus albus TaxID=415222 RepID=A0A7X1B352_9BACT|nr:hypothetical protein [Pelagicoccus albus]MBC2604780.1 hypothetical protein [Pelagicoccus albus]